MLAAVAQEDDEGDDGERHERDDREGGQDERERRHEHDRELRDGEDPAILRGAPRATPSRPASDVEGDRAERDRTTTHQSIEPTSTRMPSTRATISAMSSRFSRSDAAEAAAAVLDRRRAVHGHGTVTRQPYQVGTVSQVRPARRSARRAACGPRRWWKRP